MSGHRKGLKVYVKHPRRNFDVMQIVFLKKKKCSLEKKIKNKKNVSAVLSISSAIRLSDARGHS